MFSFSTVPIVLLLMLCRDIVAFLNTDQISRQILYSSPCHRAFPRLKRAFTNITLQKVPRNDIENKDRFFSGAAVWGKELNTLKYDNKRTLQISHMWKRGTPYLLAAVAAPVLYKSLTNQGPELIRRAAASLKHREKKKPIAMRPSLTARPSDIGIFRPLGTRQWVDMLLADIRRYRDRRNVPQIRNETVLVNSNSNKTIECANTTAVLDNNTSKIRSKRAMNVKSVQNRTT